MTAVAVIEAGACGFRTTVRAVSEDSQQVTLSAASDCETIRGLAAALDGHGPLDAYAEIDPRGASVLMATVHEHLRGCCQGCAVPAGFFKAMQVAAGLALPVAATLRFDRTN